jgi:PIN domain nuclease of toxin-antitoxin system
VRLLLDSHTLIWAVDQPTRLTAAVADVLQNPANELLVSAGTIWEISIKTGLKKLTLSLPFGIWMDKALKDLNAIVLPITVAYADLQAGLPDHHRDPFDRLLIAQAISEAVPIASADPVFDKYAITRLW